MAELDMDSLVRTTSGRLLRVAARILGEVGEAEDVLQEVYVRAFEALERERFRGQAAIETWLYRMTVHAAIDALRARQRRSRLARAIPESDVSVPASHEAVVALRELSVLLERLPVEQRTALVLTQLEGLSNREAGDVLGITEGAVEQRLIRARAALERSGA